MKKLLINNSRIKALQQCEAKFYFQFIRETAAPNTSFLFLGSTIDQTINKNYTHKIKTKKDYKLSHVLDIFNDTFNELKNEAEFTKEEKVGVIKDMGIGLISNYHTTVAPNVQPKTVQREIKVEFPNLGYGFVGTIDREDGDNAEGLKDVKTRKTSPSKIGDVYQPDYRDAIQLKSYAMAKLAKGEELKQIQIEYIIKLKEPKTIIVDVPHPTRADIQYFENSLAWTHGRIEDLLNDRTPVIPNRFDIMCSKKYCKFWRICEQTFKGKVKD